MRNTFSKQAVEARTGRELGPLLRELYVEKRHTFTEIGDALGVSRETVRQWALECGITADQRAPIVLEAAPA